MSDIRTVYNSGFLTGDYALNGHDLHSDDSLETAVLISLFTDRRAKSDDIMPDESDDPRGWWANAFLLDQDEIGSRLWLLHREKQTQETLNRAKGYIEEALAWLVTEGIAEKLHIEVEMQGSNRMAFSVEIVRPKTGRINFKYDYLWQTGEYSNGV